jgi:hypothetical protein
MALRSILEMFLDSAEVNTEAIYMRERIFEMQRESGVETWPERLFTAETRRIWQMEFSDRGSRQEVEEMLAAVFDIDIDDMRFSIDLIYPHKYDSGIRQPDGCYHAVAYGDDFLPFKTISDPVNHYMSICPESDDKEAIITVMANANYVPGTEGQSDRPMEVYVRYTTDFSRWALSRLRPACTGNVVRS